MAVQFSLANALRATTWLCVSGGAYAFLVSQWRYDPLLREWPQWMPEWILILLIFLIIWSPVVAVGALFGHTRRGMIAGIVVIMLYLLIGSFFLPKVR